MVLVAHNFASSKENNNPKKGKTMKEQATTPQAKRLTIHFYASTFTAGQRHFVRRPVIA